ncbi:hypothetical protein BC830DRAFT_680521 [Chytriomyces sp. MP71]|nr:hypothetical protein BC830DRAFT_680521 [Chytriomyces sp. MP71]
MQESNGSAEGTAPARPKIMQYRERPNRYFAPGERGSKTGWRKPQNLPVDEWGLEEPEDYFASDFEPSPRQPSPAKPVALLPISQYADEESDPASPILEKPALRQIQSPAGPFLQSAKKRPVAAAPSPSAQNHMRSMQSDDSAAVFRKSTLLARSPVAFDQESRYAPRDRAILDFADSNNEPPQNSSDYRDTPPSRASRPPQFDMHVRHTSSMPRNQPTQFDREDQFDDAHDEHQQRQRPPPQGLRRPYPQSRPPQRIMYEEYEEYEEGDSLQDQTDLEERFGQPRGYVSGPIHRQAAPSRSTQPSRIAYYQQRQLQSDYVDIQDTALIRNDDYDAIGAPYDVDFAPQIQTTGRITIAAHPHRSDRMDHSMPASRQEYEQSLHQHQQRRQTTARTAPSTPTSGAFGHSRQRQQVAGIAPEGRSPRGTMTEAQSQHRRFSPRPTHSQSALKQRHPQQFMPVTYAGEIDGKDLQPESEENGGHDTPEEAERGKSSGTVVRAEALAIELVSPRRQKEFIGRFGRSKLGVKVVTADEDGAVDRAPRRRQEESAVNEEDEEIDDANSQEEYGQEEEGDEDEVPPEFVVFSEAKLAAWSFPLLPGDPGYVPSPGTVRANARKANQNVTPTKALEKQDAKLSVKKKKMVSAKKPPASSSYRTESGKNPSSVKTQESAKKLLNHSANTTKKRPESAEVYSAMLVQQRRKSQGSGSVKPIKKSEKSPEAPQGKDGSYVEEESSLLAVVPVAAEQDESSHLDTDNEDHDESGSNFESDDAGGALEVMGENYHEEEHDNDCHPHYMEGEGGLKEDIDRNEDDHDDEAEEGEDEENEEKLPLVSKRDKKRKEAALPESAQSSKSGKKRQRQDKELDESLDNTGFAHKKKKDDKPKQVQGQLSQEEFSNGRRSTRTKVPPLKFWANERVEYEWEVVPGGKMGIPVIKEVKKSPEEDENPIVAKKVGPKSKKLIKKERAVVLKTPDMLVINSETKEEEKKSTTFVHTLMRILPFNDFCRDCVHTRHVGPSNRR